ncbi:MAG: hypothetical protein V8R67_01405 [Eubacterium sp.]
MMKAHSAEKQLKKSLILREKRLDYLGRNYEEICEGRLMKKDKNTSEIEIIEYYDIQEDEVKMVEMLIRKNHL